ncbi:DUF411 domain-containing protein [Zhengella sp. ZM62]|uniref:DUF411 domain-containing protein n=1 Tax=Zhengella sedimenti TaxID=3390035 RepID=UPI00397602C3
MNTFRKKFLALSLLGAMTAPALAAGTGAPMTVYKSPWCGCCEVWADAVKAAGFAVEIRDTEDLEPVKAHAGVPDDMVACHTAMLDVDGRKYVVEGHVPLEAIDKLMSERPDIRGIAVPGMPQGSLGMGHDENARYTVHSFTGGAAGTTAVFFEAGVR